MHTQGAHRVPGAAACSFGIAGSCSCNSHWQRESHSQVEGSDEFELNSFWAALGAPQQKGGLRLEGLSVLWCS